MRADAIDQVIKNTIKVMESSKYQIFEICESARSEGETLKQELILVAEETAATIAEVDKLEMEYRKARVHLADVSKEFSRYSEEDIKIAYEAASALQMHLTIFREKENHLRSRRDDLQKRVKKIEKTIERAELVVTQMNVVHEYLSGDLTKVSRLLESAKNRQLFGVKIILAQEEERKRVAREIHDGMAQTMANVVIRTEIAERMLAKQEVSTVMAELADLKMQLRKGLEEVRKIIFNLRPMAIDDLGLIPTLRKYVHDFEEKSNIKTRFELTGKEVRLPSGMEIALFRLVQESFSNITKHANASRVSVVIDFQPKEVMITIWDNGVGFDVAQVESNMEQASRFGLIGMRERVELLEGSLEVESKINVGTKIRIRIPNGMELREE